MSAQIIQFPRIRAEYVAPKFYEWLHAKLGCRKAYVVKRRSATFRGVPWGE